MTVQESVLEILRKSPEGTTANAIAMELDSRPRWIATVLSRAEKQGLAYRGGEVETMKRGRPRYIWRAAK
jgi:hypothetical protein